MVYFQGTTDFRLDGPAAVTLGKFDGVHRGHQVLMQHILEQQELHPEWLSAAFVLNSGHTELIMTPPEQKKLLEQEGISALIHCPFVPEISGMGPEQFIREILCERLHARYVAVGSDFRFGWKRSGDIKFLSQMQQRYGYTLEVIEKIRYEGREISSTYVREALSQGNLELVRSLLGREFSVSGTVIHGKHLGTRMGMPTANISVQEYKCLPPNGVYFSKTLYRGMLYRSVTNIGCKPTVDGIHKGIETCLLDFSADLYGEPIEVRLLHFVRPEQKFDSIDSLRERIRYDLQLGREFFAISGAVL